MIAAALPGPKRPNVPAITVLQRSDLVTRVRRWLPLVTGMGAALVTAGALLLWLVQSSLVASFAGLFVGLFGGVTMGVPGVSRDS